ncbi:hypothetical protein [Epibacterium sp. Ofav1-8]|uniref:hypothetical protein n=1 Tax=Epibacterium sp. Ofav1-8 TaxID=2917735 RepID=UPI001EF406D2|nr:hypothetical protein [Epibacterium sp. Ofav1-8]MCG7622939.1 hypothetical protein [Epibacterium sp. Ofav1-8]
MIGISPLVKVDHASEPHHLQAPDRFHRNSAASGADPAHPPLKTGRELWNMRGDIGQRPFAQTGD